MSYRKRSRIFGVGLGLVTCAITVAIAFAGAALADTVHHRPHRAAPAAAKCLCGYGISGYESISCVPVKDCEWEHATCRGTC